MGAQDLPGAALGAPTRRRRVADRLGQLFPGERVSLVPNVDEMADRFDALTDQRPSTCGAYALSYLFPALGFDRHGDRDLTAEDYLAHLAGVVIEDHEVAPSEEIARKVAAGELTEAEAIERFPRIWYRYPVRASADPVLQGTSPTGVARAIAVGTDGALATLPIPGRDESGKHQLTPERWEALLDLLEERLDDWQLHGIFNYQTDLALKPDSPEYTAAALARPGAADRLPRDDWGVGHFAGFAGLWRRPWGERWLLLMDTYKERGFDGYQPQPAELMRRTLIREDGRGGGFLLVVPADRVDSAAGAMGALGLEIRPWSNGSPDPDDWTWELGR